MSQVSRQFDGFQKVLIFDLFTEFFLLESGFLSMLHYSFVVQNLLTGWPVGWIDLQAFSDDSMQSLRVIRTDRIVSTLKYLVVKTIHVSSSEWWVLSCHLIEYTT